MNEFLRRLKERKLVQWTVAYCASAFALVQLLDIVAQRFGWPGYLVRFTFIALAVGFFVTLVLAWYHGERGAQRVTGTENMVRGMTAFYGWEPVAAVADMDRALALAPGNADILNLDGDFRMYSGDLVPPSATSARRWRWIHSRSCIR
jgi:hypothetical protein